MASFGLDLNNDDTIGRNPNFKLDVGSVIGRSFSVWGANLVPFTLVGVVVLSPVLVGYALLAFAGSASTPLTGLLNITANILGLALTGSVTYGVFQHIRGERAGTGDILRMGLAKLLTVWGTGILAGLAIMLGLCALLVPGLILMVRFWLAVPVAVIESPGASASLSRSTELSEGNRWALFALALVMGLVQFVTAMALGAIVGVATIGDAPGSPRQAATMYFVIQLLVIPTTALAAVAPAIAYHDLRKGKEGADVEELLKAFD
jgi:hypothetical protein